MPPARPLAPFPVGAAARAVALAVSLVVAAALAAAPGIARAQAGAHPTWPFAVGEALDFQVSVSRLGDVGTGRMWIEGDTLDGRAVWRLRFEMEAGKGPVRASDRTSSWVDPRTLATLRFEKRERHVLSRSEERVRIDAPAGTWRDAEGPTGALAHPYPLDELSFLYYLRTLRVPRDTILRLARHFDAERNPTFVRLVGRDTLTTPAGIFRTRIIEMEVRDPKRYRGTGTIRIHLSEGDCPVPVRIESRMPILGTTTLTLTGWATPPRYPAAPACGL